MEVMRGQHYRKQWDASRELNLHEAFHNCLCDELVAVDATVNDERAADNRTIVTRLRQLRGKKRDFEGSRNFENVYSQTGLGQSLSGQKRAARLFYIFCMPASSDEG